MRRVGIIGGAGWLGRSIAGAGLAAGVLDQERLMVSHRSPVGGALGAWPGIAWTEKNEELARLSDVIVLSVRPQQFADLDIAAGESLVVSVMAGMPVSAIRDRLGTDRVVRAMPNAAAEIGRSYSPWFCGPGVTADDREFVAALLRSCGEEDEVASEDVLDYLTGLSGSGPAFPALLAEAMVDHARRRGVPEPIAYRAVLGVVRDAPALFQVGKPSPTELVRAFTDYGGTTAAALDAMREEGFPQAVGRGLDAAAERAAAMAGEVLLGTNPALGDPRK